MPEIDLPSVWEFCHSALTRDANSMKYVSTPVLAERAKREAKTFSELPVPKNESEMYARHAEVSKLRLSWDSELSGGAVAGSR